MTLRNFLDLERKALNMYLHIVCGMYINLTFYSSEIAYSAGD